MIPDVALLMFGRVMQLTVTAEFDFASGPG